KIVLGPTNDECCQFRALQLTESHNFLGYPTGATEISGMLFAFRTNGHLGYAGFADCWYLRPYLASDVLTIEGRSSRDQLEERHCKAAIQRSTIGVTNWNKVSGGRLERPRKPMLNNWITKNAQSIVVSLSYRCLKLSASEQFAILFNAESIPSANLQYGFAADSFSMRKRNQNAASLLFQEDFLSTGYTNRSTSSEIVFNSSFTDQSPARPSRKRS